MSFTDRQCTFDLRWVRPSWGVWFPITKANPVGELIGFGNTKGDALRYAAAALDAWNDEVPR